MADRSQHPAAEPPADGRAHRLPTPARGAWRVTAAYVAAALLWIVGTDLAVSWLFGGPPRVHHLQTIKGLVFIVVTGAVLFAIAHYALRRRARLHDALLQERERYRLMVEAVTDYAIYLLDAEGRIATWNAGAERITGRTAAQAIGRGMDCLCAHDQTPVSDPREALAVARATGAFSAECPLVRRDGSTFWATVHLTPLRGCDGAINGFVNVTRDISARKAAEAALAAHAEQYRLMFAAHPLPMWVYDLESLRILAVNNAAVAHYGYTHAEFTALTVRDIRPAEDLPAFLAAVDEVRAGRDNTPISRAKIWRHLRKDGSIIHVEITSHVIEFEGRKAELILAHDVTARLRAEHELEESRTRLAGIIESAMDAIITVSPERRVVVFNRAAEQMFGHTAASMPGRPFAQLLPERLQARCDAWFGVSSLRLGAAEEFAGRRADGTEFPAEASIAPGSKAGASHFIVIMRDVTQRRRADAALAESRQLLQVAVDTARLGFWHFDIATRSMTVSTEWKRQLGLETADLSTDPEVLIRLVHPDDVAVIRRTRAELESGRTRSLELEFRARHRDGGYRDIRACAVLQPDASGAPARIFGTNLDITSVRDAERTVRRLSAHILRLQDFERRRIARELHDTTAQNLAALNMNLAQLDRALSGADPAHARLIEETTALADLAVQEIRTISYLLHPPLLDALGLPRAAQDYVEGFSARSGIETSADIDDTMERLPEETEIALFRVLQESLGNVHRHSGATHAHVRLAANDGAVELTITDEGHGMDPPTRDRLRRGATVGVGIIGMTERLEQLGGTLQILSSEEGTTVSATVPLPRPSRHPATPVQDIPDSL